MNSNCQTCQTTLGVETTGEDEMSIERRITIMNVCKDQLYPELCDWSIIKTTENIPFCGTCFGIIKNIVRLDDSAKGELVQLEKISVQYMLKILKLRKKHSIIKLEIEEKNCKICKTPKNVDYTSPSCNELFSQEFVDDMQIISSEYLVTPEIFQGIFSSVESVNEATGKVILPICQECYGDFQVMRVKKTRLAEVYSDIEKTCDEFTIHILNTRRTNKHLLQSTLACSTGSAALNEDDDDCEIIDAPPVQETILDIDDMAANRNLNNIMGRNEVAGPSTRRAVAEAASNDGEDESRDANVSNVEAMEISPILTENKSQEDPTVTETALSDVEKSNNQQGVQPMQSQLCLRSRSSSGINRAKTNGAQKTGDKRNAAKEVVDHYSSRQLHERNAKKTQKYM